jgi:hypothetical protein
LVVVVKFNAFLRQKAFKSLEVLVRAGGAAMQEQDFDLWIVSDAFGPDLVLAAVQRYLSDTAVFYACFFIFQALKTAKAAPRITSSFPRASLA